MIVITLHVSKTRLHKPIIRLTNIKEWLRENDLHYNDLWRKYQLIEVVKHNISAPLYENFNTSCIKIAQSQRFKALTISLKLNPIEMIWGIIKHKVAEKNVNRPASNVKLLTDEAFSQIGIENWRKCCKHVQKIKNQKNHLRS